LLKVYTNKSNDSDIRIRWMDQYIDTIYDSQNIPMELKNLLILVPPNNCSRSPNVSFLPL
jgi:hypothetical protein